jgi:DNA-directed RNA polymerase subunit M/transcription elongation factor TFIIS
MQFCSECHNMYYLKISDEEGNIGDTLIYYCRNCGHEDTTLSTTNICVSDMQLLTSEKKYTHIVNEYTKFDPTLPRINTIKCPNQECSSNGFAGGVGKSASKAVSAAKAEEKALKAASKAEEKAMKAASKAEEKATKAALKAATKKTDKKKTGLSQVLEEQEELEEAQIEQAEKQAEEAQTLVEASGENNREVIYIRYDDTNMKYVYLCVHCDTTWRTDNRL